jgi:hypothetical protein
MLRQGLSNAKGKLIDRLDFSPITYFIRPVRATAGSASTFIVD